MATPQLSREQLVRLLAEAFAVLNPAQITEMAQSPDLPAGDVCIDLLLNEREWEEMKDEVARGP